jgi:glucokinase
MTDPTQVFIGVDIGGTKIGLNGVDAYRRPLSPHWIEVPSHSHVGPAATTAQIVVGLRAFLDHANVPVDQVAGIGVDSPGPADINGRIERSANMHPDWEGFQLRDETQTAVAAAFGRHIPVCYENDCNAAALWESFSGDPTGQEVMFLLAPGTGLGGGIVVNGRLLRGARGMGGELGHVDIVHPPIVPGWTPSCGCGGTHCSEAYASMAALMKLLPAALAQPQYKDHPLNQLEVPAGQDPWRKRAFGVRALAAAGDPLCQSIFDWQSEAIGKLARQVANTVDPTRIVIGGGFIEGGPELTARVIGIIDRTFRKLAFKKHAAEVKVEPARSGDQAGCLGAALSAWQYANERQ